MPSSDCFNIKAREKWTTRKVSGSVIETEAIYYWDCFVNDPFNGIQLRTLTTKCNQKTGSGDANRVTDREVQRPPWPVVCGGGDPPIPDPYDGARIEACCHPICTEVPPDGKPCCGCYVPQ